MKPFKCSKLYCFYRPYCLPYTGYVLAVDRKSAIKSVNKKYGFASDTKARLVRKKVGVL